MDDKQLWELCESSGFTKSKWWPKDSDGDPLMCGGKHWRYFGADGRMRTGATDARARILAGLVEWGTADDRRFCDMDDDWVQVHTQYKMHLGPHWIGSGENLTLALLACFKSWKESQ